MGRQFASAESGGSSNIVFKDASLTIDNSTRVYGATSIQTGYGDGSYVLNGTTYLSFRDINSTTLWNIVSTDIGAAYTKFWTKSGVYIEGDTLWGVATNTVNLNQLFKVDMLTGNITTIGTAYTLTVSSTMMWQSERVGNVVTMYEEDRSTTAPAPQSVAVDLVTGSLIATSFSTTKYKGKHLPIRFNYSNTEEGLESHFITIAGLTHLYNVTGASLGSYTSLGIEPYRVSDMVYLEGIGVPYESCKKTLDALMKENFSSEEMELI